MDLALIKNTALSNIITRTGEFKTITPALLDKISNDMVEIDRAISTFGRQNSQTTSKLMSLNMISHTPYRQLRQCLAQIERKRSALKENLFKLRREEIKLEEIQYELSIFKGRSTDCPGDKFKEARFLVDIEEAKCSLADAKLYYEGALKEVGIFQAAYKEICESHNIPLNWDEMDFELEELQAHKKTAFLHSVRDLMTAGALNMGTLEYLEQFGIPHMAAYHMAKQFIESQTTTAEDGSLNVVSSIQPLYDFLDRMAEMFKDSHLAVMNRIGIKSLITEDFLYREP